MNALRPTAVILIPNPSSQGKPLDPQANTRRTPARRSFRSGSQTTYYLTRGNAVGFLHELEGMPREV